MAAEATLRAKCLAEFLGTFLLIFTVECNVLVGNAVFAGLSIGAVLFVSIQALGGVSGANFNPAVSVALGCLNSLHGPGMPWNMVGIYCAVQLLAGLLAALLAAAIFGKTVPLEVAAGSRMYSAAIGELLYTFMLSFVVLNVAAAKKNKEERGQYFGLAIGFCVVAGAYGAGAVSGGAFNPAVAVALDLTSLGSGFGNCIMYAFVELLGAALAALVFSFVRPGDVGRPVGGLREPLLSEFIGTFILVLTVACNILASSPAGALSIAASLAAMIYSLGDISGAHFNPAVSCAILCSGRDTSFTSKKALLYALVQISGGAVAVFMAASIFNKSLAFGPKAPYHLSQALLVELVFTFVLSYVVLAVAVSAVTKTTQFFGLAIGFCVVVGGFACGSVSGGSLNPAVSIALTLTGGGFWNAISYGLAELLAGVLAATAFSVTHARELETSEAKAIIEA